LPHPIAQYDSAVFSAGDAYELFMGRWSRRLAPQLVQFAAIADGDHVLDVGCGTGALTEAIAAGSPSGRIVGIDRSAPYVALAQARHHSPHIRFHVGDAQQLPFDSACFDRAVSLLILNFIPSPRTALKEMIRVTRPRGTVAAAVWDYGDGMEMLRAFWDEAIALAPDAESRDEGHMPLSRHGELAKLWRSHDFQSVAETPIAIDTSFSSFDDYWSPFLARQGPAGAYLASLSGRDIDRLRLNLRRRLLGDGPDRRITLRARAWAVRGTVP
jgi:SAM-dependent methyltransferase